MKFLSDMPKVDETPELVGAYNANLLPAPSVVAANVALKLPCSGPKQLKFGLRKQIRSLLSRTSGYPRLSFTTR